MFFVPFISQSLLLAARLSCVDSLYLFCSIFDGDLFNYISLFHKISRLDFVLMWISVMPLITQWNDTVEADSQWLMLRCMLRELCNTVPLIWPVSPDQLWGRAAIERVREMEACDTLHRTLMRGREPKELGNKIRCNSIQLLLSRHGWRFKTHPVKIRFTDEEEDCSSHSAAVCYAATASHSQKLWFISTPGIIRLRRDLKADSRLDLKENAEII